MPRKTEPWKAAGGGRKRGKQPGPPAPPPGLPGLPFRVSLGYVVVTLGAVALFNILLLRTNGSLVPYSDFKAKIEAEAA